MIRSFLKYWTLLLGLCFVTSLLGQSKMDLIFTPADTLNKKRFNWALGVSATTYTGFSIGLYNAWYKKYPQEGFHTFNDWNEWENMDKMGHLYTSYFQGVLCYKGAKWTGLSENKALTTGLICGTLFQTTIEVMDGFSSQWGWSWGDFAFNNLGLGAFYFQQKHWGEQRISFKVSSWPKKYSTEPFPSETGLFTSTLDARASGLYGATWAERYLKDYNAQIIWASFNLSSFTNGNNKIPKWLNIAVGYGAENMFGGFENRWEINDENFILPEDLNRYQEFYIGLDVDLTRIKIKNPFLKSLFSTLNIFKAPMPAIEINTRGEFTFHLLAR